MNEYVVSYISFFDNELKMVKVSAHCERDALVEGLFQLSSQNAQSDVEYFEDLASKSAEEIKEDMFDTDAAIQALQI